MNYTYKKAKQCHTRQLDESSCGVACLQTILKVCGSKVSAEPLRDASGTTTTGTTMLGLLQAANSYGLEAEGFQAEVKHLKENTDLCILHVIKEERLQHYIVIFGYDSQKKQFLVSDPADNKPDYYSESQLEAIWKSKKLLLIKQREENKASKTNEKQTTEKWLVDLLKKDSNILVTALVLGVFVSILGLTNAMYSRQLIDKILPSKDHSLLLGSIAIFSVLLIAQSGISYVRSLFLLRQGKEFTISLTQYFFGKLLGLPQQFFDNRKTGDLVARLNDIQRIQGVVAQLAGSLMIDILIVVATIATIFYINTTTGWLALTWIPFFSFLAWKFHPKIVKHQKAVMSAYSLNESQYIDTIKGVADIKRHNKQNIFSTVVSFIFKNFQEAAFRLGKVGMGYSFITSVAGTFFTAIITGWNAWLVFEGVGTSGDLIAVLQMSGMLMASVGQIAGSNILLQEAKVSYDRITDFTNTNPEQSGQLSFEKFKQLNVQHLSFRFPGQPLLLNDISFDLKQGEIVAILGESGSGKSSLLKILEGLYPSNDGNIGINGNILKELNLADWRNLLGVVSQETKIFNDTIIANILLGDQPKDIHTITEFLDEFNFEKYFSGLPQGYGTLVGEEGANLSGGQKRMLSLLRALWGKPQVLFLDEPTSGLDRKAANYVRELLAKQKAGLAILLCTHNALSASIADRIYILENGVFKAQGTPDELLKSDNLYSQMVGDWGSTQLLS